jgi:hypothetical protein
MKKMQCPVPKLITILFSLFLLCSSPALSQISNFRLQTADSLFTAKQYTQSLQHYEKIFAQNQYSPAMLMKMAFIEEGLNHIGQAMYYLNLYYLKTLDHSAIEKMWQLSEQFKLEGYANEDAEFALSFYRQYEDQISYTLAAIMFFFFSLIIFQKRRNRKPVALFVALVFFAIIFLGHLNLINNAEKVIVSSGNTYVMEGPSGAAPVVEVINPGHRLTVLNRKDIWIEIEWKGRSGYIKQNRLLPIATL